MKEIVDLLRAQPAFISAKAPTAQEVTQAEKVLGVTFAADYRDYVAALGVASYEGHELTGVRRRKSAQRWRRISRVKMNRKNARSTKCRKSDCKGGVHAV